MKKLFVILFIACLSVFKLEAQTKASTKSICHIYLTNEKDTDECAPEHDKPSDLLVPGIKLSCGCPKECKIIFFEICIVVGDIYETFASHNFEFTDEMKRVIGAAAKGTKIKITHINVSTLGGETKTLPDKVTYVK